MKEANFTPAQLAAIDIAKRHLDIRDGRMEVAPADRGKCRFCDCADVCRIELARPATAAEGA